MNSGMKGERQASCNSLPMVAGEMRSARDRPEPLSITSSEASMPRPASQDFTTSAPRAALAGAAGVLPSACTPARVNSNRRAMTLLLYLFMSRMVSASAGDSQVAISRASDGTAPSTTFPEKRPPRSCHILRNTREKYRLAGIWYGTTYHDLVPQETG